MTSRTTGNISLNVVREGYEACGYEVIIGGVKTCDIPFCCLTNVYHSKYER